MEVVRVESALVEIFTNEAAHYQGIPVNQAVVQYLRSRRIAARVHVYNGIAGAYESGEFASINILDLSANLPLKIEILLPAPEVDRVLPHLAEMVTEGAIAVRPLDLRYHRSERKLLPGDLRVCDIMTAEVTSVTPETPVPDVVRILMDAAYRGLPVIGADGRVVGIVTEDDLVTRAKLPIRPGLLGRLGTGLDPADPAFAHLARVRTADVMTAPADTIAGTAFVHQAVQQMVTRKHRTLPVVDPTGRLAGMCSRLDVIRAAGHWSKRLERWEGTRLELTDAAPVREAVTDQERCVGPDATVLDVGRGFAESGIRRVAVVDGNRNLLGIVAESDLLKALEPQRAGLVAFLTRHLGASHGEQRYGDLSRTAQSIRAGAIMTRNPVVIKESESLRLATALMAEHQLKELPVVDEAGRFEGFLSRRTLMRAMVATGPTETR
jgi:CBS domain-containing protein